MENHKLHWFKTNTKPFNGGIHGHPHKIFPGGEKVDVLLILFSLLAMQCNANRCTQNASPFLHHKENAKCYDSVFPPREFYTKQMFVLVSIDILRLS